MCRDTTVFTVIARDEHVMRNGRRRQAYHRNSRASAVPPVALAYRVHRSGDFALTLQLRHRLDRVAAAWCTPHRQQRPGTYLPADEGFHASSL